MEKIKITREQEEALESYKIFIRELKTDSIQYFIDNFEYWQTEFKPLQTFTPEQFLKLLCGWYEVEQPFKVGDWVYNKLTRKYRRLTSKSIKEVMNHDEVAKDYVLENMERYEKIEELWKIMLLELGRDKPEFKEGDRYITVEDYSRAVTHDDSKNYALETAKENRIKYFYPVESRIEVKDYDSN